MLGNAQTRTSPRATGGSCIRSARCLVAVVLAATSSATRCATRWTCGCAAAERTSDGLAAALEVTNLTTHIKLSRSVVQAVGNVDLAIDARRDARPGRRVGLRASRCSASRSSACCPPAATSSRARSRSRAASSSGCRSRSCGKLRGNDGRDDLPGLAVLAEPDEDDRRAGRRARAPAPRCLAQGGAPTARSRCSSSSGCRSPRSGCDDYPHQLSGGLRQRVMIAIALSCEPKVLIADEPTTALDVTIQAQILALLDDLEDRLGMATLLVTHDMGVVAGRTDRINVMYAGRIVETAPTGELFSAMRHPYTQALLGSIPRLDQDNTRGAGQRSRACRPTSTNPPPGCRFAPRCPLRDRPVPRAGAAADRRRPARTCSPAGTRSTGRSRRGPRSSAAARSPARAAARDERTPARDRGRGPRIPGHRRRDPAAEGRLGEGGLRGRRCTSTPARRSAWWASPAAARRRSAS